ncbi:unnamed protein product, partial [Cuscuta europaea]
MTGVWVEGDGPPGKGSTVHNNQGKQTEQHRVTGGGGRHVVSEEHESRFHEVADDRNDTHRGLVKAVPHTHQQHPLAHAVRWERFLPLRSLKVLLVENDECTRHVVSALLRNCSYEVTAVANGVDAWNVLGDLTNHIDLVLTEVAMPYLSGIDLLSKIVNHKTHKSVPVIMMSSNDSMGVVFKCLSKGAVDFLVKPIRKNELKNLWQHVWRKCHSSGGSGSESGIRIQKSTKSKSIGGSDDSSDGNDENGSDNGSGTQGSWSNQAVEGENPQAMLQWDELAEAPDSTCAQAIHSRPEANISNWDPRISAREHRDEKDGHGTASMGKDLQIGVARTPDLQPNAENGSKEVNKLLIGKLEELNTAELQGKDNADIDVPTGPSKETGKTKDMPSLELSLKQHREVVDAGVTLQERNVLRHSDQSAFSRYGGGTTTSTSANPQATIGNVGSCSPVNDDDDNNNNKYNNNSNNNNSSEAAKAGSMHNSNSMPNQRSSGGSNNNNDMGSSTSKSLAKPSNTPFGKDSVAQAALVQSRVLMQQQQVQVQHHHHHYHHHHHHVHSQQQNDSLPIRENGVDVPNRMLGDEENYTSASGSNNGSNGQNESNTGVVGDETNNMDAEDDEMDAKCTAGGGGGGNGSGSGSRSGVMDQSRQTQREAALYKFRQKRKERNFDKKVRYQSRKRLAEQRPRIRGQFVSQQPSSSSDPNNK